MRVARTKTILNKAALLPDRWESAAGYIARGERPRHPGSKDAPSHMWARLGGVYTDLARRFRAALDEAISTENMVGLQVFMGDLRAELESQRAEDERRVRETRALPYDRRPRDIDVRWLDARARLYETVIGELDRRLRYYDPAWRPGQGRAP